MRGKGICERHGTSQACEFAPFLLPFLFHFFGVLFFGAICDTIKIVVFFGLVAKVLKCVYVC